jgi:1A family penicillin-binding protein
MNTLSNVTRSLLHRCRPDPGRPARIWMRRQWLSLALMAAAIGFVGTLNVWLISCGFTGCPTSGEIRTFRPLEGSQVLGRDGEEIGRLSYVRRVNVELAKVPLHVKQAFLATEDRRFYEHNGLDWRALGRASARNIGSLGVREGFSTITMQVARNTFTTMAPGERTLRRKLLELRLARLIESNLGKDEILELYLNAIYLGSGNYGVEAASRDLFGKGVERLSLSEGAVLAALPKGPSSYTPRRSPDRALQRRNLVLGLMTREGFISESEASTAAELPLRLSPRRWNPAIVNSYAIDAVRNVVDSLLGQDALTEGDVRVITTLDGRAQRAAEQAVQRQAARIGRESARRATRGRQVEGAMVALDPRTGEIRALVGGREYVAGGFNRALSARRQPGSAFKPFVYAAALSAGFTPASLLEDTPLELRDGGQIWRPATYGHEYSGQLTMRRALARSSNVAAVRLSRAVGEAQVVSLAQASGISNRLPLLPSIALGAVEVTPLEIVSAYAPFANGGFRVTPRLVERIETLDGRVIWSNGAPLPRRVLGREEAYQLTSMLRSAVDHGTGRTLRDLGVRGPVAGKTGTTNNGADVWFIGYTPTLVAGFWFGYDTPASLAANAAGGRYAAPAWAEFYQRGWRETSDESAWQPPQGMISAHVDPYTGYLAHEWCPGTQHEWFKAGTEPTTYCPIHQEPVYEWLDESFGRRVGNAFRRIFRF